jgi:hypothetical protein
MSLDSKKLPALPQWWTADQVLAVYELLEHLHEQLW